MGIGLAGHTAGIMPSPKDSKMFAQLFENKDKWVVGYNAGQKNNFPMRITVSISFLCTMVEKAFVYVSGESKKGILNTILNSNNTVDHPASVVNKMKLVELFTDID